jgi:uncharacterized protein
MSLQVNLRHLENGNVHMHGEMPVAELDLDVRDEVLHVREPLRFDLDVQMLDQSLLVRGRVSLTLDCECVRCLKPFSHLIQFDPWTCHLPLEGEDKVPVENDCVDLTPHVREDIFLAFPRHPLCQPECSGLARQAGAAGNSADSTTESAVWAELNKLKLGN